MQRAFDVAPLSFNARRLGETREEFFRSRRRRPAPRAAFLDEKRDGARRHTEAFFNVSARAVLRRIERQSPAVIVASGRRPHDNFVRPAMQNRRGRDRLRHRARRQAFAPSPSRQSSSRIGAPSGRSHSTSGMSEASRGAPSRKRSSRKAACRLRSAMSFAVVAISSSSARAQSIHESALSCA